MELDRRLQLVFTSVFGPEIGDLSGHDSPTTVAGWDSVSHLNLILSLEAEFGVQFEAEEIASLNSVQTIRERLQEA